MKKFVCALVISGFIFTAGCSRGGEAGNYGSTQMENAIEVMAQILNPDQETIIDKFRTELSPVNGLTTKGQRITTNKNKAVKPPKTKAKKTSKAKSGSS